MSQTLPNEQLIRGYFLGDLPEYAKDSVEVRLFEDPDFFETLLVIEGELLDEYGLGLLPEWERVKLERGMLSSPQQYEQIKFARVLKQYVSDKSSILDPIPQGLKTSESDYWEQLLSEAQCNRNVILSLMSNDWLGLQVLARLEAISPATRTDLAAGLELLDTDLTATIDKLFQCGLVDKYQGKFSCSLLGADSLENIRKITGSDLGP